MQKYFSVIKYINRLKGVTRHCKGWADRPETSAEHSWSVAMYVWMLHDEFEQEFGTSLNKDKMIKMALVHDLVEIESSDTSVWLQEKRKVQEILDAEIAPKVFEKFPKHIANDFSALWEELEDRKTLEAQIVHGLDRLSAAVQRLVTDQGWHDVHATDKDLDQKQITHIQFSKTLLSLYEQLKKEAHEKKMFADD